MREVVASKNTTINAPATVKKRSLGTPINVLHFILIGISIAIIGFYIASMFDSEDMPWMLATGNAILQNGFITINPFTIVDDLYMPVQQWLFCVIIALFSKLGTFGLILFSILNQVLIWSVALWYLSKYNVHISWKILAITLMLYFCGSRLLVKPRPETITIVLLLCECIAIEKFRDTDKWQWLLSLPILILLESNLHSSMVWFHFAIVLAYIVPFPKTDQSHWTIKKKLYLLSAALLQIPVMFINPYGIDAVLYLPNSLSAGTFSLITVNELSTSFGYQWVHYLILLLCISILVFLAFKHALKSEQIWCFLGFGLITLMAARNGTFLFIAVIILIPELLIYINNIENAFAESLPKSISVCFIAFAVAFIAIGIEQASRFFPEYYTSNDNEHFNFASRFTVASTLAQILQTEDVSKQTAIFTGFDYGGYFEYLGYTNIYIDARPELFMKQINKKDDVLTEYVNCCRTLKITAYDPLQLNDPITAIVQPFLDKYDFQYLVIEPEAEKLLAFYLDHSANYVLVSVADNLYLYKKAG